MSVALSRTILDLKHDDARRLLMQPESYCTVPLPEYYDFSKVLSQSEKNVNKYWSARVVRKGLKQHNGGKGNVAGYRNDSAELIDIYEGVNYRILSNKDGLLSWRPMELINPLIYSSIVYKLTEPENWKMVQRRFDEFQSNRNQECCSIPRGVFQQAQRGTILNWWNSFEQKSIALSLEYPNMVKTDISDCYGAIYTHSISWALHGKSQAKSSAVANGTSGLLGDYIDSNIQNMHSRQTVGIPQGSVLSDLIAEMVLGYADMLLSEELSNDSMLSDRDYWILRYRDDYRIFATSREGAHSILLKLMNVLSGLNFKLSAAKTAMSDDVVLDSVKADKVDWLLRGHERMTFHKRLLALSRFARDYPQSGTIVRELQKISKGLESAKKFPGRRDVLIAQVVDIVVRNPRCYPIGARILSQLLEKEDRVVQQEYLVKIVKRCRMIPNSGLFEIWLQRIARVLNIEIGYAESLCCDLEAVVAKTQAVVNPWPWQWLTDPMRSKFESLSIVDLAALGGMSVVISSGEAGDLFSYSHGGA